MRFSCVNHGRDKHQGEEQRRCSTFRRCWEAVGSVLQKGQRPLAGLWSEREGGDALWCTGGDDTPPGRV